MQNINPTKSRNRRASLYLYIMGLPILLMGVLFIGVAVLLTQLPIFGDASSLMMIVLAILGFAFVIGGSISTYRGMTLAEDNEMAYYVGEVLAQSMGGDPRYRFIRNVSRRGLGYVDAILVGPPGALVFRVVDYDGHWRNERAQWHVMDERGKMRGAPSNPSRECARDVYALRRHLKKRRLEKIPVYGIVVFTNPHVTLQGSGQVVPITKTDRIYEVMSRDYLLEERISKPQIEATVDAIIEG